MASRYVSGFNATIGSATLPQGSLYASASVGYSLIEAAWFSGNVTAKRVQLIRLTTTGTQGAAQTAGKYDDDSATATASPRTTHTVAPTLGDRLHGCPSVAAAETGIVYSFHDRPIECPLGTANGIGFLPTTASGAAGIMFVWDEG